MKTILRGRCLCGSVRYECAADPGNASYCHCDDCKRATGGPYTWASWPGRRICGSSAVKSKAIPASPTVAGRSRVSSVRIAARPCSPEPRSFPILSSSKRAAWMNRNGSIQAAKHGPNGRFPGPTLMRSCRAFRKAVRLERSSR